MYHIAIVEDEISFSEQLKRFLRQYEEENNIRFKISVFCDAAGILEGYEPIYDVILMDIEMPGMNGMEAAAQIRRTDADVVMMFITNVASYALRGYEVGALDFVMKPLTYYAFAMRFARVLKRVRLREQQQILLTFPDGVKKLEIQQIYYVEVQNRILHYHTDEGEYCVRGTMQSVEQALEKQPFAKCNHWYIVNLKHVSEVRQNTVVVGGHMLEISRRNRTPFLKALAAYVGGIH
ncbi:MAG: LytTR family DNA-binding domain-containing protein [Blautia sp.]|nr:LytTR family DNA-binding domain-containing protein [Blautia sp.]MCM1201764.1 LytTR family DNA-binding domain-containing protein [Bacteroides fragilis]